MPYSHKVLLKVKTSAAVPVIALDTGHSDFQMSRGRARPSMSCNKSACAVLRRLQASNLVDKTSSN
eukprot:237540-Pleurochrysis_carterae.AAC.1